MSDHRMILQPFWLAVLPLTVAWASLGQPYNFTTIDSGLNAVSGVAADSTCNLYTAQRHMIQKLSPSGTNWLVTTIAGSEVAGSADGTNSDAHFNEPRNLVMSGAGVLYVADFYNRTVRQVAPVGNDWIVTTIAGLAGVGGDVDGTNSDARFNTPLGITMDDSGTLYVSDAGTMSIKTITQFGTNWAVHTIARFGQIIGLPGGYFALSHPAGLAADHQGNIFIANPGFSVIQKLTQVGTNWMVTTLAGTNAVTGSTDGTNSAARFNGPIGIAIDSGGNLYVCENLNNTDRKMTRSGADWVVTTIGGIAGVAGLTDGYGTNALFNYPYALCASDQGNLVIADLGNTAVRLGRLPPSLGLRWSPSGIVLSWPAYGGSFVVERSGSLSPGATWTSLGEGVPGADGYTLTNSPGSAAAFFRLRLPSGP
jgi:hypothetical protein